MTKRVQLVRHDNAGANLFQGKLGEITVNTGNKSVHVHDGTTIGGIELARADVSNVAVATSGNAGKMSAQQAAELTAALLAIGVNAGLIGAHAIAIATNLANILTNTNKLATIETNADVTDTVNVTAAGALMDSEVDADLKTLALPANTTISVFGRTLVDDATASAARTTLGLGVLAVLNSVAAGQIDADAVGSAEIAAGAVGTSEIATGAVGQAEIAADSVGQSEIKTTYQEVSTSVPDSASNNIYFTPSGGIYILGNTFRASANRTLATASLVMSMLNITTSDVAEWNLAGTGNGQGSFTLYGRLHYINASPPYDLGFGNIPLFIFLVINNATQEIEAVSVSTEAPWHYNGPTNITPDSYAKDGKTFKHMKEIEYELLNEGKNIKQELRGPNRAAITDRIKNDATVSIEINQAFKNADMPLFPHPFMENNLVGKTVAVINPQSAICETLLELHKLGESITELFHTNKILVGNVPQQRGFDAAVKCFDATWA